MLCFANCEGAVHGGVLPHLCGSALLNDWMFQTKHGCIVSHAGSNKAIQDSVNLETAKNNVWNLVNGT